MGLRMPKIRDVLHPASRPGVALDRPEAQVVERRAMRRRANQLPNCLRAPTGVLISDLLAAVVNHYKSKQSIRIFSLTITAYREKMQPSKGQ